MALFLSQMGFNPYSQWIVEYSSARQTIDWVGDRKIDGLSLLQMRFISADIFQLDI